MGVLAIFLLMGNAGFTSSTVHSREVHGLLDLGTAFKFRVSGIPQLRLNPKREPLNPKP